MRRFPSYAIVLAGFFATAGIALAQSYAPVPQATINPTDLIPDTVSGNGQVQSTFATPAQIAGVPGYSNGGAATTGFTFTFANTQTDYFIQPAGTLATGTLTTAANPSDGQRECFLSTQTQTALTWTANTGQTIANAPTAGVAMTPICITYQKSAATWYRSP